MSGDRFTDLPELAKFLRKRFRDNDNRRNTDFILIYAYNGTGKTRLSMEFKDQGKDENDPDSRDTLYFNAFTEDLFTWDNDLEGNKERKLHLNPESRFFDGLADMEMDNRIRPLLNRYADFYFRIDTEDYAVHFSRDVLVKKDDGTFETREEEDIKISRGEESVFIWCFFLAFVQLVLDEKDSDSSIETEDEQSGKEDSQDPGRTYKWVKHIYIDDPISSLDEHNAIVAANHLVQLYRESERRVPTIISTHHTLFFNVLHYEIRNHIKKSTQCMLTRDRSTGGYLLQEFNKDTPQFYHVTALEELWRLSKEDSVSTYHFNVLRSILEKTAFFHGYSHFSSCIKQSDDDAEGILHQRYVDILSHGKYSMYEPVNMQEQTRDYFRQILQSFVQRFPFNPELLPLEEEDTQ